MLKKFRWFYFFIFLLFIAAIVFFFSFKGEEKKSFSTAKVTRALIEDSVMASGTLRAFKMLSVGAQVTGQVKALHVKVGDKVKKGQLIAEIDDTSQKNALEDELAGIDSLKAQKLARQSALEVARLSFARQKEMFSHEATSKAELLTAENQLAQAQTDLKSVQMQLVQAELKTKTARANVGYTRITAPMDGVVVAVITEAGQTVNAAMSSPTLVKIAQLENMLIDAQISEADVMRVSPDMPAYFTLLGDAQTKYPSKLESIDLVPPELAKSDSTSSSSSSSAIYYNGILSAPNQDGKLRVSMTAQVFIIVNKADNALSIPSTALGKSLGGDYYEVRILENDSAQNEIIKKVKIGLNNRVNAEILEGLNEGDIVITDLQNSSDDNSDEPKNAPPPPM